MPCGRFGAAAAGGVTTEKEEHDGQQGGPHGRKLPDHTTNDLFSQQGERDDSLHKKF
jgi:hypothetical protein